MSAKRSLAVGGFAYLWVLIVIALAELGLVTSSEIWVTTVRQQRARELGSPGAIGRQLAHAFEGLS